MLRSVTSKTLGKEGYLYTVYGDIKYLKHCVASVTTLRRYDAKRPVALVCEKKHRDILEKYNLLYLFDVVYPLAPEHASIVGFKHNIHEYLLFESNIFVDNDIIWCKNPDDLWTSLSVYEFTITGILSSDAIFEGPFNFGVFKDLLLRNRTRTLNRFGLSYLSRIQSGIIYARDHDVTARVCHLAQKIFERKKEIYIRSHTKEYSRSDESCEWSLAMAMSKLNIPVYPWFQGHNSPQLDYVDDMTDHDPDFKNVSCKYYSHPFIYSFRGLKSRLLRKGCIALFSKIPGNGDYFNVTPYCLHFGWLHQKQPFYKFSEKVWTHLKFSNEKYGLPETPKSVLS